MTDLAGRAFRTGALLLTVLILAACVTPVTSSVNLQSIQTPAGSNILEAGLGDIVLESANVAIFEAIILENEVSWGDGVLFLRITVPPGRLVSNFRDESHIYYESDRATVYDSTIGTMARRAGICVGLEDTTYVRGFFAPGRCDSEPNEPPVFTATQVRLIPDGGYRQELIYTGRNADRLRFVYREIPGDDETELIERQLEFAYQQGQPIAIETASFEVVEASNALLHYRVLSPLIAPAPLESETGAD